MNTWHTNTWVLVLEGHRRPSPRTTNGLEREPCLDLARRLVAPTRIITVGSAQTPSRRSEVQVQRPTQRGTTPDLLLGLLQVLARDLSASVVVVRADVALPADVGIEEAVTAGLHACEDGSAHALLIAAEAAPCQAAGWHVSSVQWGEEPWPRVLSITEVKAAQAAPPAGVLVDTSVLVGNAWTLANLIHDRCPEWFRALRRSVWNPEEIDIAFASLPASDLLNDVLLPSVDHLHVVPALRGWKPLRAWPQPWPDNGMIALNE